MTKSTGGAVQRGALGTYMALASLLPWVVFSVLVARRLFRSSRVS